MSIKQNRINENESTEKQWKSIYMLGCITTLLVISGSLLDIIISFILGGDLSAIPKTAIDRFSQFHSNWLLGLYNLDMLNLITTILMIPTYFALYVAHRRANIAYVKLAIIIFIIGAAVFITNNSALPMLELSKNYFTSTTDAQKTLLAAAGEAMLARGAHGSPGAFLGFILSSIASILMSFGMLKGKIFSKVTAYLGILGGTLLLIYLILVTFTPDFNTMAMMVATPGGLLSMAWLIMFTIKLFKLRRLEDSDLPDKKQN
jgi:hypothetical protein